MCPALCFQSVEGSRVTEVLTFSFYVISSLGLQLFPSIVKLSLSPFLHLNHIKFQFEGLLNIEMPRKLAIVIF